MTHRIRTGGIVRVSHRDGSRILLGFFSPAHALCVECVGGQVVLALPVWHLILEYEIVLSSTVQVLWSRLIC